MADESNRRGSHDELDDDDFDSGPPPQTLGGKLATVGIVLATLVVVILVLIATTRYPRTDDAEVYANFIGIAPLVEGPLVKLAVKDNQLVHRGDLLYQIDDKPYLYSLEHAKADQQQLEGEIRNQARSIQSQESAALAARAGTLNAQANVNRSKAAIESARQEVQHAEAALKQEQAEYDYANNNYKRLEPLLAKQYVTVDQVDRARSSAAAKAEAVGQAEAQLRVAQSRVEAMLAEQQQAVAQVSQSQSQAAQSAHAVNVLDPFIAQRGSRAATVARAQYDYDNTRIYAPFDARVTNLTISEGAYAHVGQQLFTLIDTRVWWVIANFRETQLTHIRPGMHAQVYVMSKSSVPFDGVVDSLGYGVTPDADVVGMATQGLPSPQRTLNWVHLASRYPIRIRVLNPPPELFRVGETAVVVLRGDQ
jgi:multidrug efflux system membrane fusion protein